MIRSIKCMLFKKKISQYVDNQLDSKSINKLEEHIKICKKCNELVCKHQKLKEKVNLLFKNTEIDVSKEYSALLVEADMKAYKEKSAEIHKVGSGTKKMGHLKAAFFLSNLLFLLLNISLYAVKYNGANVMITQEPTIKSLGTDTGGDQNEVTISKVLEGETDTTIIYQGLDLREIKNISDVSLPKLKNGYSYVNSIIVTKESNGNLTENEKMFVDTNIIAPNNQIYSVVFSKKINDMDYLKQPFENDYEKVSAINIGNQNVIVSFFKKTGIYNIFFIKGDYKVNISLLGNAQFSEENIGNLIDAFIY